MSLTKNEQFEAGVLLPIYQKGSEMKKEDIIDEAEKRYFNTKSCPDFLKNISSQEKTSGRKSQEWAIQRAFEHGIIDRMRPGYYEENMQTQRKLENLAEKIEKMVNEQTESETLDEALEKVALKLPVLNIDAVKKLHKIYTENESQIQVRQAEAIRDLLNQ